MRVLYSECEEPSSSDNASRAIQRETEKARQMPGFFLGSLFGAAVFSVELYESALGQSQPFEARSVERQASTLVKNGAQVFPQAALDRVLVEEAFLVADFFGAGSKGARKRPV